MQQFELFIQNEKADTYKKLASFIILLNVAVFAILIYYTNQSGTGTGSITAIIIIAVYFILNKVLPASKKPRFEFESSALFIISFTWLLMMYWWQAAIFFVLLFLYKISQRPLIVSVSSTAVIYPSFPKKEITWNELNNVVLKDDLLTIDFKNNKIIQQLIQKKEPAVDEQEFNDFCKMQLKSGMADI
ncbi:hypothetical protein [Terrimonas pollutisoli]|uniref:hypothetical protein n=1 Tax=Terrimonas pollutisoli TaxID=3034147 RepID=UPI0023ED4A85|nr:hypothetical protein [Terrimonas sp. H1YJ31]